MEIKTFEQYTLMLILMVCWTVISFMGSIFEIKQGVTSFGDIMSLFILIISFLSGAFFTWIVVLQGRQVLKD